MRYGMIDQEQIEELADRLTGDGFAALTADDWPVLVLAMEALSDRRMSETVLDEARAELAAERERTTKLREALEFYANTRTYQCPTVYMCGHSAGSRIESDAGSKARAVLKETEK